MFCPRCSAENKLEQKFCRQCGLQLRAVRLALEGRLTSGIDLLKKDFNSLSGGIVTLGIFTVIALINWFFDSDKNWGILFNLVLGLLISTPLIVKGLKRVERAIKMVDTSLPTPPLPPSEVTPAEIGPERVADTDPLAVPASAAVTPETMSSSVTEETTQNLSRHKPLKL